MAGTGLIIGGMAGSTGNGGTRDLYIFMAGLGLIIGGTAGLTAMVGCGIMELTLSSVLLQNY